MTSHSFLARPAPEDGELVTACGRGDKRALGELFDRYHVAVYRFLSRASTTSARDLDDLVQNTFLEVQRAAPGFGGRASVKTWLFGIAANVARHHVRGEARRRQVVHTVSLGSGPRPTTPDHEAENREMLDRLGRALSQLPYDLRVAFVACELEELPGAEVAQTLGIREGTLWRRLHDARKALATALERLA